MMIAVAVFILHVTEIVILILNKAMISAIAVLASSASQKRAAAPCAKIICCVKIIAVVVPPLELYGVVHFRQNFI